MILNTLLYIVAGILAIYIIVSIAISKKITITDAIALLGIIVSIVIAQSVTNSTNSPEPTTVLDLKYACGASYTVEAGKPFILRYGMWFTRGVENATENSNHLVVTLAIDGQIINGIKQPIQKVTSSWPGALCSSPDFAEGYGIFYVANMSSLAPGEHSVHISYLLDAPVTDGYDDDNDGILNNYGPGKFATFDYIINARE